ncbi:MAG: acyltransferase [Alphaproteobacteria bacterium]|nr:acyltransferase [Alphaproteobacteria bacterium]
MRKHLASLDGLRGVAALAVALKHFQNLSRINLHLQQAAVAVDLFFVLSGFVIAQAYEQRLTDGLGWGAYMRLRLARLYPAIFGGLVIALILRFAFGGPYVWSFTFQFALLPVLVGPMLYGGDIFPLDGPQWSLFWELVVNGLHAAVYRWLSPGRLVLIMAAAAVGLALAAWAWGWLDVGWTRRTFWCGLPRVIYGFSAGVLIYRLRARGWAAPKVPYPLILLILAACMVRWVPSIRLYWARDLLLVTVILPMIVAFAVSAEAKGRWVKPVLWLGTISYPLYTLHVPLLRGYRWLLMEAPPITAWEGKVGWCLAFVGVVAFAGAFERWYDAPIRAWLARRRSPGPKSDLEAGPVPEDPAAPQAQGL